MSRPAPRVLGGGSFWRVEPPIGRPEAEQIIGCTIPSETWEAIRDAFMWYGSDLEMLEWPSPKKLTDDVRTMRKSVDRAKQAIGVMKADARMIKAVEHASRCDPHFYRTLPDLPELAARLNSDLGTLSLVLRLAENPPAQDAVQTEADAKARLLRSVQAALAGIGVDTRPPGAGSYRRKGDAGITITPFATLVVALEIHRGNSNAALAEWLRANLDRDLFPTAE